MDAKRPRIEHFAEIVRAPEDDRRRASRDVAILEMVAARLIAVEDSAKAAAFAGMGALEELVALLKKAEKTAHRAALGVLMKTRKAQFSWATPGEDLACSARNSARKNRHQSNGGTLWTASDDHVLAERSRAFGASGFEINSQIFRVRI